MVCEGDARPLSILDIEELEEDVRLYRFRTHFLEAELELDETEIKVLIAWHPDKQALVFTMQMELALNDQFYYFALDVLNDLQDQELILPKGTISMSDARDEEANLCLNTMWQVLLPVEFKHNETSTLLLEAILKKGLKEFVADTFRMVNNINKDVCEANYT